MIVRWHKVSPDNARAIAQRLFEIRLSPPARVPRLLAYGFTQSRLRLEHERVHGRPLLAVAASLSSRARLALAFELRQTIADWRSQGFVHGDLSPRNILIECAAGQPRAWIIDWILDLEGFEATPRYAALEVRQGRRSAESDCYAIDKILCIMLKGQLSEPPLR